MEKDTADFLIEFELYCFGHKSITSSFTMIGVYFENAV